MKAEEQLLYCEPVLGGITAGGTPQAAWKVTKVVLRGHKTLTIWNPHTGGQEPAEVTTGDVNGQPTTVVHLKLASVSSLFFVGE